MPADPNAAGRNRQLAEFERGAGATARPAAAEEMLEVDWLTVFVDRHMPAVGQAPDWDAIVSVPVPAGEVRLPRPGPGSCLCAGRVFPEPDRTLLETSRWRQIPGWCVGLV